MTKNFVIAKAEVPGVYEIINIDYLEFCHLITKKDGTIQAIAKISDTSFVLEGAEAIDLLSAMGIKAPGYHPGSAALQGKDSIPV